MSGLIAAALLLSGCDLIMAHTLTTGPNGPETPQDLSVPFERVSIPSGSRHLDGYLVSAPPNCPGAPGVVIYHGVGETISMWAKAQALLYARCVSSLVFDYTGSGDSSPGPTFEVLHQDALAAFGFGKARFGNSRLFLLAHSMGNGLLLEALPQMDEQPKGLILANAFVSLRAQMARLGWFPCLMSHVMPDWWNNVRAAPAISAPVLLIASDGDKVVPSEDGREIFAAVRQEKFFVLLHGYGHNALYKTPDDEYWRPILDFIKDKSKFSEDEQGHSH
ncbi:alpha/beta hydrolase [Nitrospirillum sp. BR 11163]|uniref:alpha/beta hydrolase n=1 Tax=Nitrospirillum sp. BR 11163 TaxID=3104323 RepID=UPI002AFF67EE|nr:alpha/beta fold hydrolase [Nitrospirillum sp. BR 11163]MEA1677170.1 alpha/beta fold hydrolase [Nitrospirillum sp. BR 11163]